MNGETSNITIHIGGQKLRSIRGNTAVTGKNMAICFRFNKENPKYITVGELLRNAIESIVIPTEKATREVYITRGWRLYNSSAKPIDNETPIQTISSGTTLYLRNILEVN